LTFFWPVQEEVGLFGARFAPLKLLGKPKLAFNWDGGAVEKITIGATGGYRLAIDIEGLASHAGAAPEKGVSAIAIASLAIADLVENGWHGLVRKGSRMGTSNVGVFHGGEATNVVTDRVTIKAEARSHDPKFRARIVREMEKAFQRAAKRVKSSTKQRGKVTIEGRLDYESFRLAEDEACVVTAADAVRAIGLKPQLNISNGGLDANWMAVHGIPTVTLGCGQEEIHTTNEWLNIPAFENACRVGLRLAAEV
jgi:tripeptide aminopeptidase